MEMSNIIGICGVLADITAIDIAAIFVALVVVVFVIHKIKKADNVESDNTLQENTSTQASQTSSNTGVVEAPAACQVVEVRVKKGDYVRNGQVVMVVEAMMCRTELKSKADGWVKDVNKQVGDTANMGEVLVTF